MRFRTSLIKMVLLICFTQVASVSSSEPLVFNKGAFIEKIEDVKRAVRRADLGFTVVYDESRFNGQRELALGELSQISNLLTTLNELIRPDKGPSAEELQSMRKELSLSLRMNNSRTLSKQRAARGDQQADIRDLTYSLENLIAVIDEFTGATKYTCSSAKGGFRGLGPTPESATFIALENCQELDIKFCDRYVINCELTVDIVLRSRRHIILF